MFRPPSSADDGTPIEVLGVGEASDFSLTDVDFRAKRHRPDASPSTRAFSSRRWRAVGAVGVLVAAAFVFGNRQRSTPHAVPVATSAALAPGASPAGADPATAGSGPAVAVSSADALAGTSSGASPPSGAAVGSDSTGPIYPNRQGFGLFLFNQGTGLSDARLDLTTGVLRFPPNSPNLSATDRILGTTGPPGNPQAVWTSDVGDNSWAPCSDGTVWVLKRGDHGRVAALQRLRFRPGTPAEVVQSVDTGHGLLGMLPTTLGTTTDDRPVVSGPDRRGYVVDPASGVLQRLTDGPMLSTQHGAYVESNCDETVNCTLVLHSGISSSVSLSAGTGSHVSFSTDGSHALVMRSAGDRPDEVTDVLLIDMRSHRIATLDELAMVVPTGASSGTPFSVHWSPDAAVAVYLDGSVLIRIDVAAAAVASFPLPRSVAEGWDIVTIV